MNICKITHFSVTQSVRVSKLFKPSCLRFGSSFSKPVSLLCRKKFHGKAGSESVVPGRIGLSWFNTNIFSMVNKTCFVLNQLP